MPQIPLPLPRLLDRYVVGRFVRVLLLAGAGLLLISYISAIVDVAEKTLKGQASWAQVAAYLWYSTPQFVAWMLPVAVLVGVLATIGGLTRSGELIIMRACGVSLYRTGIPLLLVAAALGAVLFGLEDRVLGEANKRAAALRNQIRDRTAPALSVASHNWLVGEDGRVYYYAAFEAADRRPDGRPTLHGLSVFEVARAPYRLTRHTYAARASFAGGAWQVHDGWTQTFADQASVRQELTSATMPLPPVADFQRAQVNAAGMTYAELREYVRRLGASGFSVTEPLVDLHRKLAFPAVPVVMALLALPFGVTTGRKGALYGIGLAVLLAAGYYLMMTVFLAAGAAGVLPAMLAAWAANLVYAAGALVLTLSVRT